MDFRAVLVLSLFFVHADSLPREARKAQALNHTVQDVLRSIGDAQKALVGLGHRQHNISCPSVNASELGEPKQPLHIQQLSSFKCYLLKASEGAGELTEMLKKVSQYIASMEELKGLSERHDCQLPSFAQDLERYIHIDCLLQRLHSGLSQTTFH